MENLLDFEVITFDELSIAVEPLVDKAGTGNCSCGGGNAGCDSGTDVDVDVDIDL